MKPIEEIILDAYREGIFPMAESAEDDSFAFYRPHMRGLLPIRGLHLPGKLVKRLRRPDYTVTRNRAFRDVIDGCAAATPRRAKTWINRPIRNIFVDLHKGGHAHSIEVWDRQGALMGGLYGLSIGAVFCGESMFSAQRDASKIALVALCALLWKSGHTILDTQFINPHLVQFGAYEIPQDEYEERIRSEMDRPVTLSVEPFESLIPAYLSARAE